MKSDHVRCTFSMVPLGGPTLVVRFIENAFFETLGPSLGVNRTWTKGNDHAPKSECADFFSICPKMAVLEKKLIFCLLLSSLIFNIIYMELGTCSCEVQSPMYKSQVPSPMQSSNGSKINKKRQEIEEKQEWRMKKKTIHLLQMALKLFIKNLL